MTEGARILSDEAYRFTVVELLEGYWNCRWNRLLLGMIPIYRCACANAREFTPQANRPRFNDKSAMFSAIFRDIAPL